MQETTNLNLPFIAPSQAQKHVTHNEALVLLDAIVQLAVLDRDLGSPPGSPAEGDRYIVAASATGDWAGHEDHIALYQDGGWMFVAPRVGWLAWLVDEEALAVWDGSAWTLSSGSITALQELALLGLGTTADATNPFAAKLNKALWIAKTAAEGGDGDLRYTLSKEGTGDVLSLLMQSAFSGRAEIGLIGDDDLAVKVSPDGSAWTTAISVDRTTGLATLAGDPASSLGAATKQYVDGRVARGGDTMTGALQVPAGSAAAPGLALGDPDTGLFSSGGTVTATCDGTEVASFSQTAANFTLAGGVTASIGSMVSFQRTSAGLSITARAEGNVGWFAERYSSDSAGATNLFRKNRGTIASPAVPVANDVLGQFQFQPLTAAPSTYGNSAIFDAINLESTPSASALGSRFRFRLCATGSATLTEVVRVDCEAGLSMFGANPVIDQNRHHRLRAYTVATLPSASPAAQMIYVSDGSSNRRIAVSDGSAWRFPDGAVVS